MAIRYYHRALTPDDEYVYWLSEIPQDNDGEFYDGPPAFGLLTNIVMIDTLVVESEGAFFTSYEETDQVLNEFYTADDV